MVGGHANLCLARLMRSMGELRPAFVVRRLAETETVEDALSEGTKHF